MANYTNTALAAKAVFPTNELISDDKGIPGLYVQRQPQFLSALLTNGDGSVHPAFLIHGQQIARLLIGKWPGVAHNGRIYSLPQEDPKVYINLNDYEAFCKAKGDGHHCMTAAEWAFLALLCKKQGFLPKGDSNYGKDESESLYIAIPTSNSNGGAYTPGGSIGRVATGTGPVTWHDTGDREGIWGLKGGTWQWNAGLRLVKGEVQFIPYNDAAALETDTSASSAEWRAINKDATSYNDLWLLPNGQGTTPNSVRLDWVSGHWQWGTGITTRGSNNALFASTSYSGLSTFCKMFLQAMALGPEEGAEAALYGGAYFWADNREEATEMCAFRGGHWGGGSEGGVFSLNLVYPRTGSTYGIGGRPAFYE